MGTLTARQEWATMWPLPLASMVGISSGAMFAFSSGVFMEEMTSAFGWSRAQFSSTFVMMMGLGLFLGPAAGWLIDRIGPRRVALIAILPFIVTFSMLGLASGPLWQWSALCVFFAFFQIALGQTTWVAAVISRFEASRGMALAVTLAGLGLGSFVWPQLAALFIGKLGWRLAFPAMAWTWAVVAIPLTLAFFFGASDRAVNARPKRTKRPYGPALRSRSFIGLVLAAGLFASAYFGLSVHLAPLLKSGGMTLGTAAGIVGLIGVFSVIGRLATGFLLDHLPTRLVGIVAFLLPALSAFFLMVFPGSMPAAIAAVAALGLASGAELDIITFIAARRFGRDVFGSIYALFMAIVSVCASIGPVIAGSLFDATGSYHGYLVYIVVAVVAAAALIAWIPISSEEEAPAPLPAAA
ncbi:MFS transporter [Novosphingobium sp. G106]|uniref:MFS transporter n=1 Tax=Novosphingobium sp. G106 TaxID=2849500 RepID=UPI001C2D9564|nr:MFS transporter [Novosphingobium sp. G106]MBV1687898.1 MFS transporter [Novosphingobium sp. G106]